MSRIGVDVDGVLANFNEAYMELLKGIGNRDLFGENYQPKVWDYDRVAGYTKEEIETAWNYIKNYHNQFWRNLLAYDDAFDAVRALWWGTADVYFITNRPGNGAKIQTEEWLLELGYPGATVLISDKKGVAANVLDLDVYIDDKFENCLDVMVDSPKTKVFLRNRPWNIERLAPKQIIRTDSVIGIAS